MIKFTASNYSECHADICSEKPIVIYGIGQQAQVAYHYLTHELQREVMGFAIDLDHHPVEILSLPVYKLQAVESSLQAGDLEIFVAIGSIALNAIREHFLRSFLERKFKVASCVSPRCPPYISLQQSVNSFIDSSSVFGPFSSLGHNLILYHANISHHCKIGDNVSINSALIGANSSIGRNCVIALSATVESGITIGEYSLIDSGALVREDVPPYSVVSAPRARIRQIDSRRLKLFGESLNGFQKRSEGVAK
jgi:acetyltransferase-like isoleucine patch superfamily enzyme